MGASIYPRTHPTIHHRRASSVARPTTAYCFNVLVIRRGIAKCAGILLVPTLQYTHPRTFSFLPNPVVVLRGYWQWWWPTPDTHFILRPSSHPQAVKANPPAPLPVLATTTTDSTAPPWTLSLETCTPHHRFIPYIGKLWKFATWYRHRTEWKLNAKWKALLKWAVTILFIIINIVKCVIKIFHFFNLQDLTIL